MSSYLDGCDKQKRKQNKTGLKITFSLVGFGLINFNGLVLGRYMVWSSLLCLNLAGSRRMGQTEKKKNDDMLICCATKNRKKTEWDIQLLRKKNATKSWKSTA